MVSALAVLLATSGCLREDASRNEKASSRQLSDRWETDYDAALELARQQRRPMLIAFGGPRWSPPCRTLDEKLFGDPRFDGWAENRVVLLQVEVPRPEAPRTAELEAILLKYHVNTFPMVLIVDGQERVLGSIAGSSDDIDVEQWLEEAEEIISIPTTSKDSPS